MVMVVGSRLLLLLLVVVGRSGRTQSWMTRLKDAVQIDQTQHGAVVVVVSDQSGNRSARLLAEDSTKESPRRFAWNRRRRRSCRCRRRRRLLLLKLMKLLARNGRRLSATGGCGSGRTRLRVVAVIPGRLQDQTSSRSSTTAIHCRIHYKKERKDKNYHHESWMEFTACQAIDTPARLPACVYSIWQQMWLLCYK